MVGDIASLLAPDVLLTKQVLQRSWTAPEDATPKPLPYCGNQSLWTLVEAGELRGLSALSTRGVHRVVDNAPGAAAALSQFLSLHHAFMPRLVATVEGTWILWGMGWKIRLR